MAHSENVPAAGSMSIKRKQKNCRGEGALSTIDYADSALEKRHHQGLQYA